MKQDQLRMSVEHRMWLFRDDEGWLQDAARILQDEVQGSQSKESDSRMLDTRLKTAA